MQCNKHMMHRFVSLLKCTVFGRLQLAIFYSAKNKLPNMKVICSGMPKTGTKSLAASLRILGYTVYDFEEQYFYCGKDLYKILNEGWSTEDIRRIYKNVDAVTDTPGNMLWEDLLKAFPDAKVIHTERTSEEDWFKSLVGQFDSMEGNNFLRMLVNLSPSGRRLKKYSIHAAVPLGTGAINKGSFFNFPLQLNKQLSLMKYRQHNTRIKEVVSKEKLLQFKLSDGWEPLCEFLNKPVPSQEFPHKNKKGSITKEIVDKSYIFEPTKQEIKLALVVVVLVVLLCVSIFV